MGKLTDAIQRVRASIDPAQTQEHRDAVTAVCDAAEILLAIRWAMLQGWNYCNVDIEQIVADYRKTEKEGKA